MTKVINQIVKAVADADEAVAVEATGVADKGSDGNIPVEVHITDANTPTRFVGTWGAKLEQSVARNGTLRVLVQTKFPVRGLYQDAPCCSGEDSTSLKASEVTVHTVITMPKAVVDRIKAADANIVSGAAKELTLAIVAHLNDLRNAVGNGLEVLVLPNAGTYGTDDEAEVATIEMRLLPSLDASAIQSTMLADLALSANYCKPADGLVRFVRGSGVDNI